MDDDLYWQAVLARKPFAGFVYAVRSTGIYCRPECPSRRPKRENVAFFAGAAAAEAAGFRACLRCDPKGAGPEASEAAVMARACRQIEAAEELPKLAGLAAEAGLSPGHFQRRFKAVTGLSPAAWGRAARMERLRAALPGAGVTGAIYDAGFAAPAPAYAGAPAALGMTPSAFARGGAGEQLVYAFGQTSPGLVLVAATPRGIAAILPGDSRTALRADLQRRFPKAVLTPAGPGFAGEVAAVVALLAAPAGGFALPLDLQGTAFQRRVWQALCRIPPGQTASYAKVAEEIGQPGAARAVARACAGNPLAVAVPCHRVLRSDGGLSGYAWGAARKQAFLDAEQAALPGAGPGKSKGPVS